MSDMADYFLDQVSDIEDMRFSYRSGSMSQQEAYDADIIDEFGYEALPTSGKSITCRCCKQSGFHWQQLNNKWRLFTHDNKLHDCPTNPLKA